MFSKMNATPLRRSSPLAGELLDRAARVPWPLRLAGALAVVRGSVLLLSPRRGLIEPAPVDLGDYLSRDDIARAQRFARPQVALQGVAGVMELAALSVMAARAGAGRPARRRPASPLRLAARVSARVARRAAGEWGVALEAAGAAVAMSAALEAVGLPVRIATRRRALAAGLATQGWPAWWGDLVKANALGGGLAGAGGAVAVALMRRFPRGWWLGASGVAVAGAGVLTFLSPVVLDPIFNDFTPLPEGEAREDVLELAASAGVRVGEVYEVDASRRTRAANAYVTGLGATKRVVLFDTLLESFTRDERRLVIAHELAHVRHRDVARNLLHMAVTAPATMYAVDALTQQLDRSRGANGHRRRAWVSLRLRGRRADPRPTAASLPALAIAMGIVSGASGVLSGGLSRRVEARADAFALRLTDEPRAFVGFEERVVRQNLLDPDPPRWLVRLLASHPPTAERIGTAIAYERGAR